ncbi:MAG TPA: hypothetical protein VK991_13195 [Halomonas sp.]|nr:hypothetical protein [Halomonas sp.]
MLKRWRQQQGMPKTGLVSPSGGSDKRMSGTAIQKPWAAVRKLAGLPDDLVLYSLRHNFASQGPQQARDHAAKTPEQRQLAAVPASH